MKKLSVTICFLIICTYCHAQANYKEKTVFKNEDVEFRQIDKHTWHGNGHLVYNESLYLIEGDESAILLDAGTHIPGLRKIVEDIVKKPVTLVLTHAHADHAGTAINEWDSLWVNAAEAAIIPEGMYKGKTLYLTDGQVFELGNRMIEVVFTPGHTPGSTSFIDKTSHYGFSGDAFGSTNLLVSTDLSTQIATCQRIARFIKQYKINFFYPGHYWGDNFETPQRIKDVEEICEGILNGTLSPTTVNNNNYLPYIVEKYGVKVNYGTSQKR